MKEVLKIIGFALFPLWAIPLFLSKLGEDIWDNLRD